MKLDRVSKMAILMTLVIVATSCLEKSDRLNIVGTFAASQKLWQWDDYQKTWLHNGSVYTLTQNDIKRTAWKSQEHSIIFRVESAKSLTAFDNGPNALQMKIFQLSDSTAFLHAAKSSSGLKHLLISEQIDPAIVGIERLFVLPGVSQTLNLDRKENARYIGVILGYGNLKPEKIFRLIPIVTLEDSNAITTSEPAAEPALNASPSIRPAILKINLSLEDNGISKLDVDAR